MPHYIILIKWTEQGIRNIKDAPKRNAAGKLAIEKLGGRMVEDYITLGEYDSVAIVELPNDEALVELLLATGSQGNIRTTTLKAFATDEWMRIIDKLP
jgi:uncharacterized protein with GYD domain